ncbi:MAG: hypothetical protein CVU39_06225 [Chloroflexi bacterium HGW-Chloroflexi-10]|nr:MAG: hypothetical protein CVU39_06225 [Chloroflexi bacterium HGW-Chloroflexi-10]
MSKNILKQVGKYLLDHGKSILFFLICWYFGLRIFVWGYANIDFSKPDEINSIFLVLSAIGILLIILPFFRRLKVGDFEIEREVEQAKKDLSEFKNETRNAIAVMSTQITTVASIRNQNQVTVYVPGYEEANADLRHRTSQSVEKEAEEIKDEFLENQDTAMAIVKIRVQLEYLLRRLLEKRVEVNDASKEIKFMSLLQMTRELFKYYPDYMYLLKSFDYVREVGNAAAHAQKIPDYQAQETLDIGAKLIAILKDLAKQEGIL